MITMNGSAVPISVMNGSCTSPSACPRKTEATIHRAPSRTEIGTNSIRPGTCIAPIQPMIAAATVAV